MFLALVGEHLYPCLMAASTASRNATRRWGAGTAAIVRALIAAKEPLTGVALAEAVGVSQPRASQVIRQLAEQTAVRPTEDGYVGRPAKLLDLYQRRSRPALVEAESYWYSTRPLSDQAARVLRLARATKTDVAFSADLGPDLLVPWRHPTLAVVYASGVLGLTDAGFVPAEGRPDASVIVRWTTDRTLLAPASPSPRIIDDIPLTDPIQQWWDLLDLGGEDRREAADRLRAVIVAQSQRLEPRLEGTLLDRPYTLASVNEPAHKPDDLDVDAAAFWLDTDIATMLSTVKPYEGPDEFVIDDLTEDEWDRFVAALSE